MKIIPIASDSMGTRSCATFIKTADCSILIDPSAALGPYRFGKKPHALEYKKLNEDLEKIEEYSRKADIMIVTHYHYDHHNPEQPELFKGKRAFLKHPKENINKSQEKRAAYFLKQLGEMPKNIAFSDGQKTEIGGTSIIFSPAVFHGTNSKLGFVTEVLVKEGKEKFLYTSDVEGPSVAEQLNFILEQKPTIVYIDGPMTYMLGYRYSHESLNLSIENIIKIVEKVKPEIIILDHHLLRDLKWKEKMDKVENKIITAAEYAGKEINQLEAKRTHLWKEHPDMKMPKQRAIKTDE